VKWSQLKKRIEATFAPSVRGRVQVWNTRYRGSHDSEGEAWITVDGERVWSMGSLSYRIAQGKEAARIRAERGCADWSDPDQRAGYSNAWGEAQARVHADGVFAMWDMNQAIVNYLNLSIDSAAQADSPIIRAFAVLDRCFGKRRLAAIDSSHEHPLVRAMYRVRCEAEGISPEPEQPAVADLADSTQSYCRQPVQAGNRSSR